MIYQLNRENIVILGYTFLCLIINIQALIERYKKKYQEDVTPPPEIKLNFNFLIVSLLAVMFIRGLIFLLAIILLKNILLKIVALVLLSTDLLLSYGFGFNTDGEAKPITKSEYSLRTVHLFLEVCFILYFFVYYFLFY